MRRITIICAALLALAPGVAGAARRADTPSVPAAPPLAKVLGCDVAGSDRSAVFYGRMDTIPGASRLALHFTLLERLGRGSDWQKLDLPALRPWHRSAAGVKTFGYKQTVDNLRVGGAYKTRVQYRWTSAAGGVVDTQTRDTPVCRGPLPNLAPAGLDVQPGPTPETRTYRVTVSNDGKSGADGVDVVLIVDRAVLDKATITQLDTGDSHTVSITGPACAHSMRVKVDPDNTVGELDETDNTRLFSCPS